MLTKADVRAALEVQYKAEDVNAFMAYLDKLLEAKNPSTVIHSRIKLTQSQLVNRINSTALMLEQAANNVNDMQLDALKPVLDDFRAIEAMVSQLKAQLVLFNQVQSLDDGE